MNTKTFEQFEFATLTNAELSTVEGGGKNSANAFLTGFGGAVEGVVLCAQAGMFLPPHAYAACAAGGAAASLIWPH
ncbi:bacteriocin [Streptococcus chenjunshii]|uniref:Bacteriocin n=1 Tax=Streptococcus chenjunshii TaxID=2173853 RepID=A0A372KP57_9STRE|nr:Blp family class II bacteriocin [Streptococcus chenjunshii]AXQ79133.1 bacteriocin [Streptococcus chenjunshii]RFU50966.1 bacteriocin [Streptococcus chenjunshii]RFU53358.1 bacteriocin [Streptococcus chenjunshii]